jgi:hypothetical protein
MGLGYLEANYRRHQGLMAGRCSTGEEQQQYILIKTAVFCIQSDSLLVTNIWNNLPHVSIFTSNLKFQQISATEHTLPLQYCFT